MQSQLTDHVLRFGGNLNVRHFPHPHVLDLPCQPDALRMSNHDCSVEESSNKFLTFSILFPLSNKRERATTTGHPRLGIFVDISQAAPGRTTTVDPAAGASARRREGQRVDAEPSQRRVAPAISLLAAILFFSGVVVTITCLSLPPNCLRFVSVHELNAF